VSYLFYMDFIKKQDYNTSGANIKINKSYIIVIHNNNYSKDYLSSCRVRDLKSLYTGWG